MLDLKRLVEDVLSEDYLPQEQITSETDLSKIYRVVTHHKKNGLDVPSEWMKILIAKENNKLALNQFFAFINHIIPHPSGKMKDKTPKVQVQKVEEIHIRSSAPTPASIINPSEGTDQPADPFLAFLRERSTTPNSFQMWKTNQDESNVHPLADKSIQRDESIVSEALAEVLANQGKKDEAIAMYEQLILKKPEKTSFFAAQIENLKKK